ncbi:MAG: M28 family peptidase [Bacteroidetes bacterium]|nr:M28 family peptidase [Bacteroidota bacterium]
MRYPYIISILLCLFFFSSCKKDKIPQENILVKVPAFDEDSAYFYLEKQLSFGPRHVNSEGHSTCKNWLIQKSKEYSTDVIIQDFKATAYTGETLRGTNIISRYNPQIMERVLLCAHWDTRHIADKDTVRTDEPISGADDGASGVAILIEIMRQLKEHPIPMGVDIIFFDAEDYGNDGVQDDYSWGLGSQFWSKNLHEKDYSPKYGILLDMVGSKDARFKKEGFSMRSAPKIVNNVWRLAHQMGYENYFLNELTGPITDDHRFIIENTRIPMIDIINTPNKTGFGLYHHTHSDNLQIIDKSTLNAVGQLVLATVYRESNNW